ncbi:hypothetical protein H696_04561 [Fonticula alba]|uniref:Uncharacterized protein n=1 Tax=Fonticula alba TaxID=691883 RepID=A0A058Z4T8_FONAL|nr:hypothetical protein H696_04561 [Fonticula alba]KCV69146.1 hypothetical protein H696_04561 [Fonticula alba]|eukprot:XP_009496717.1 hypothetical protein H696_04561 [Fonticula alba]
MPWPDGRRGRQVAEAGCLPQGRQPGSRARGGCQAGGPSGAQMSGPSGNLGHVKGGPEARTALGPRESVAGARQWRRQGSSVPCTRGTFPGRTIGQMRRGKFPAEVLRLPGTQHRADGGHGGYQLANAFRLVGHRKAPGKGEAIGRGGCTGARHVQPQCHPRGRVGWRMHQRQRCGQGGGRNGRGGRPSRSRWGRRGLRLGNRRQCRPGHRQTI